jgi:hypothetical protein
LVLGVDTLLSIARGLFEAVVLIQASLTVHEFVVRDHGFPFSFTIAVAVVVASVGSAGEGLD